MALRGPGGLVLLGLSVALEAVVEPVQQLCDLRVADRMVMPSQFVRDRPGALTHPAQRRFRIAPRLVLDHRFQGLQEAGGRDGHGFAPTALPTDAALPGRRTPFHFTAPLPHPPAPQPPPPTHPPHSPITQPP